MNFEESTKRIAENRKRILELKERLGEAIRINNLQRVRLLSYEEELMVLRAELKSIEKQMSRKKFSLKNIFKFN